MTNGTNGTVHRTIGHVGLGAIGLPVAENLIAAGFPAIGYRRTREALAPFLQAGGTALGTVRDVYAGAEVVVHCLPTAAALHQVVEQALPAVRPGTVVVELSTYALEDKRAAAARLETRGAVLLDAAVSGTPGMTKARACGLFVSGPRSVIDTIRPVLDAISENVVITGAFGTATRMKLVANHLLAIHTLAAAEALALARAAGLDPHEVVKVVAGGAGSSRMFEIRGPWMAEGRFEPAPGPIDTLRPYLDYIDALAREVGGATPLLDVAKRLYDGASASGRGHQDIAAMVDVIADLSPTES